MKMNIILILVIVGTCSFVQAKDCNDLQEKKLTAKDAILGSPYTVVFDTFNSSFYCAQVYFTSAVNGRYNLSATYIKKNKVIDNMDMTSGTPASRWGTHLDCTTGFKTTHRFLNIETPETAGMCTYSCDSRGKSIRDFLCFGRQGWSDKDLNFALEMVKGVPGAPSASQQTPCALPKGKKCAILS